MNTKRIFTLLVLVVGFMTLVSCKGQAKNNSNETTSTTEVTGKQTAVPVHITKADFLKKIYNYEANPNEWKYLGDKPAIIDLYADWCGPCRMTAPIMKELAKEYAGKIVIYKVNVDKEKELAALFNATSIPLFVFIPMQGEPQLFRGAADKATYKKAIDEFLLKK